MELNKRQSEILRLVEEKQKISVSELSQTLFFSEMTIRRDLSKMEHAGYLKRYHGGALSMVQTGHYTIEQRMFINEKEKREMARCAEKHLSDGQTVFLPGCSTCAYLLPLFKGYKGIHVITNSVEFLRILSEMQVRCTLCGGEYYAPDKIVVGAVASELLRSVNYDVGFFSCDGIDDDGTVTVYSEDSLALFKSCFKNSKRRILISDHSKLHKRRKYTATITQDADDIIML